MCILMYEEEIVKMYCFIHIVVPYLHCTLHETAHLQVLPSTGVVYSHFDNTL